ncbi:MAG: B12-binding domain-containing radical SAM protein [Desulfobulbaceae bacterium]|nr:B12-binding domain-containing radical SAM protein [Desulfobulbaceae bacterium]
MKITLVSPSPHEWTIIGYGVRILSSCLKREGWDVNIFFFPRKIGTMYEEQAVSELVHLASDSDLIGISVMTDDYNAAVQLSKGFKARLNVPLIWGGIHPTIKPKQCLEHADIVCIGEGEEALPELVRRIKNDNDIRDIRGLWFNDNDRIIKNPLRPLIQDLDSIPFQDYGLEDHYMLIDGHIQKIDEEILLRTIGQYYLTMTTRGCPSKCTYCWNHTFNRMYPGENVLRKRSIDNVIRELVSVKDRFPFIKLFCIDDDAFFMRSLNEIKEFSEKYIEAGINCSLWVTGASPTSISREKVVALVNAGMNSIRVGIEAGSERIKKMYKRPYSNQQVEKAVQIINEFRDKVKEPQYDLILDNPWESQEEQIETLSLLAKFPTPYRLFLYPLTFYPGTDLYDKAKEDGFLLGDSDEMARKSHHSFKDTYINRLFVLLFKLALKGRRITPMVMALLTSPILMRLKISEFLYRVLELKYEYDQPMGKAILKGLKGMVTGEVIGSRPFLENKS